MMGFSTFMRDMSIHIYMLMLCLGYYVDGHRYKIFTYIPSFMLLMYFYHGKVLVDVHRFILLSILWNSFAILCTYLSTIV